MEAVGGVRPEDVVEVGLDVVEGDHVGEGVLLVEGGADDQAAVAYGVDIVVEGAEDGDVGAAGEAAADLVVEEAADPPGRGRQVSANEEMSQRLETAMEAYKANLFRSVRACALAHRVSPNTLGRIQRGNSLGGGRAMCPRCSARRRRSGLLLTSQRE